MKGVPRGSADELTDGSVQFIGYRRSLQPCVNSDFSLYRRSDMHRFVANI
jgi:hypothetical protein